MNIINSKYANSENTSIVAHFDGIEMSFLASPGNCHYDDIVARQVVVALSR